MQMASAMTAQAARSAWVSGRAGRRELRRAGGRGNGRRAHGRAGKQAGRQPWVTSFTQGAPLGPHLWRQCTRTLHAESGRGPGALLERKRAHRPGPTICARSGQ